MLTLASVDGRPAAEAPAIVEASARGGATDLAPHAAPIVSKVEAVEWSLESVADAKVIPVALPLGRPEIAQGLVREVEPNNTAATATPLGGTDVVAIGNLPPPGGDVDFWSFTADAGDRVYAAVMTSFSSNASTDSQLDLIASDGVTSLEFDDDDGTFGGLSSSIAGREIPAAGTYYLRVRHFTASTGQLRPYHLHLSVQSGAPAPEIEPNDTPAQATPLPASGWVSGVRNPAAASEVDYYVFSANAGDTVFLSLDLDPERDGLPGLGGWNGRLGLGLLGDASNQILVVDDANAGTVATNPASEALFVTVKTTGTYFAFVDSASATTGSVAHTYHLSVRIRPATAVGQNCTTYTSTDVPKTIPSSGAGPHVVDSTIVVPGNPRIEDVNVSIVLNHTLMVDIDAALLSPAGNENSLFTDIGATATGGQVLMDATFDDEAGIPPAFTVMRGPAYQPELAYRLAWLKGELGGGTWTLRLRDDVPGSNGGTLTAWSLEICEAPPAPACGLGAIAVTKFATDFEANDGGFTLAGAATAPWQYGTPTGPAHLATCNSGTKCWKTNLGGNYNNSANQDLLSPGINLAGLTGPVRVEWAQKYQLETATNDTFFAEVREVGGANPQRLFQFLDATMTDTVGSPTTTIQQTAGWGLFAADISAYAGKNIQLRYNFTSNASTNFAGLAIDDVKVTACCTPASCDDGDPCTTDVCDPVLGCVRTNQCDDGNACTIDTCDPIGGGCSYAPVNCDDGNACTDDACNPASGCFHTNNTAACNDGNPCTVGDTCSGGSCQAGPPGNCPVNQFCNAASITIPSSGIASPYPSTIGVAGLGFAAKVTMDLKGITHTFPDDIDVLLVGPAGQNAIVLSDVGGSIAATGINLRLDDAAASALPDAGPLVSGTFRPTNVGTGDPFPAPAPTPSGNTALGVFAGTNPDGTWSLYVVDDAAGDSGSIGGGWCLQITHPCVNDLDCDDGNPCTDDSCSAGVCVNAPNSDACDDGNPCTTGDVCSGGSCQPGAPNTDPCDDGDPCSLNDTCSGGACSGTLPVCDDGNPCTNDILDPSCVCQHPPIDCGDGNACTVDLCDPSSGCFHVNACTDVCDPNAIVINDSPSTPTVATPYPATLGVTGAFGSFELAEVRLLGLSHTFPDDIDVLLVGPGGQNAIVMSDAGGSIAAAGVNLTLADSASLPLPDAGPLVTGTFRPSNYTPADTFPAPAPAPLGGSALSVFTGANPNGTWSLYVVDDTNLDAGSFGGGWCLRLRLTCAVDSDCDDGNACTDDACVNSVCQYANNTGPCSDGDACTTNDTCSGGQCVPGTELDCDDDNDCTDDSCDPATGCVNAPNTESCDDGNACTTHDTCSGGTCVGGAPPNCDDGNVCTDDSCDPATGCVNAPNTGSCDDGDACTVGDACSAGTCVSGSPRNCDDGNVCTDDSCDPATGCVNAPNTAPCDDGNACTVGDQCAGGTCRGGVAPNCDDGNACTDDSCDPATGCRNDPNTAPCDDGDPTTCGDVCGGGVCAGTPVPEPAEINTSVRLTKSPIDSTISWSDAPGPYNVYRGTNTAGSWSYNQTCYVSSVFSSSTVDTTTPAAGSFAYYLVTRVDQCRESSLGRSSFLVPRPNASPCP